MLHFFRGIPLLLVVAALGCGDDGPELASVSGVVTLDGQPLPDAVVTFTPKAGGPGAVGKTGSDGRYQLMTAGRLGAVPGEHTVSIIDLPEPQQTSSSEGHGDGSGIDMGSARYRAPKSKVPPQYNSQTQLTEQVERGSNTINFELKS